MKKVLVSAIVFSMICGCATFGTFPNFEKGKTDREDVRAMLGEPLNTFFEEKKEVWEYHFFKENGTEESLKRTIMDLTITFEEDLVDDYKLTVSKKSQEKRNLPPLKLPPKPHRPPRPGHR